MPHAEEWLEGLLKRWTALTSAVRGQLQTSMGLPPRDVPKLFLETSPDTDLCLAARLTRRLDGLLTASRGARQQGLRVTLLVPGVAALFVAEA